MTIDWMTTFTRRCLARLQVVTPVAVFATIALACPPAPQPMPSQLIGTWRTDAPSYQTRRFEVRSNLLRFATSEASAQIYIVEGVVELTSQGDRTDYRIHFREPDGERSWLDLSHHPGPPPTLRFVNRSQTWIRVGSRDEENDDA